MNGIKDGEIRSKLATTKNITTASFLDCLTMALRYISILLPLFISAVLGGYVSYPRPSIYKKSNIFSLKINGTYMYTVGYTTEYDYVQLSLDEGPETEYRISLNDNTTITDYQISPLNLNIQATAQGNELVFSIKKAHYLIVKINSLREFVILADPAEANVPKSSGPGIYNVLDYNADATGAAITTGVQDAIDAAAKTPGSTVFVPPGLYLIGNLLVRDRTSLYLAGGAVLRFTGNPSDYKTLYTKSDLGPGTWWIQTEVGSTNIKIYGRGTIDGNGHATRQNKFMSSALVPVGTKNFVCDGILVRDSSFWAVIPTQTEDVTITNIKILDRFDVTQDDGIDVVESTNVTVRRAIAIANDDSFSAKTWQYNVGTTVPYPYQPLPLSNVLFDDCFAWTFCYGWKIGEGVWQHQDGVTFQNSVGYRVGAGLGIHHKYGSNSASHISYRNMDIESMKGAPGGQGGWLTVYVDDVKQGVGPVDHVYVKNVRVRSKGDTISIIRGVSDAAMVSTVTLTNVIMPGSDKPATSLSEMNILDTKFSENIKIVNE